MRDFLRTAIYCLILATLGACAGGDKTADGEDRTPRRVREMEARRDAGSIRLATTSENVRTIQFYRGDDERLLPIYTLRTRSQLSLEFDLLEQGGRPLSVYFYHADREWRRDLAPAEYLRSFQRDEIVNYQSSRATEVDYVHYQYRFPNETISFGLSGNYIIRVTEQGVEDNVLFERPFFISEQATSVDVTLANVLGGGQEFPLVQPFARFLPPAGLEANVFGYTVCFVRNGVFGSPRCVDNPSLMEQPALQFYLEPNSSFEPQSANYFLDLSILQTGGRIERSDLGLSPFEIVLEPDYARFPGSGIEPVLIGQSIISGAVRGLGDPDLEGEYVSTRFTFVPDNESPLTADVAVVGAFTGWQVSSSNRLEWRSASQRYEGEILIKQGQYEYRYSSPNRRVRSQLERGLPRPDNVYTAFVYYDDAALQTDRLLAVNTFVG